jgi:tellurite resistance protein TerC
MADRFDYLQEGIGVILIFIGAKMLLEIFNIEIGTHWSLIVIAFILVFSIALSLLKSRLRRNSSKKETAESE